MLLSLPSLAGRIVTDTVKSQILSADVPLNVYLPDGYDIASQRFPIIYLLMHILTYLKIKRIYQGKALNLCLGETARNIFVYGLCVSIGLLLI